MKKLFLLFFSLFLMFSSAFAVQDETVLSIPELVANVLLSGLKQIVIDFVKPLLDLAKTFIIANPNPMDYQSYWQAIIVLISSFYLLVFIIVGFKFILGSYDEVQRFEAKEWAKKAILIVILTNLSLLIYSLILSIGSGSALYLWNNSFEQLFQLQDLSALNLLLLILFAGSVLFALITLFIRYIIVLVGIMAFPIGIFLYLIPPLKSYGKIILNTLGIVIFLQFIDVLILIASSLLLKEFSNLTQMQLLAPIMGFLLIGIANILLIKFAITKAASGSGATIVISKVIKQIIPAQRNPQTKINDYPST